MISCRSGKPRPDFGHGLLTLGQAPNHPSHGNRSPGRSTASCAWGAHPVRRITGSLPALNRLPILWAAAFRQGVAAAVLLVWAVISPHSREYLSAWRPSSAWRVMVPATLLGSYLALTLWIAGMKYTLASVAGILGQSSTLWILVFSVLFLRERFSRRKALAAVLALAGVLLVTLG